jgi:SAM-dependent methyltransferase
MIGPRPAPFCAYTTPEFWNDPHISARMLGFHLHPDVAAASRTHAFIDRSVAWLTQALDLDEGARVLDLGCGPGLYANRLAALGIHVLGFDVSARSLAYAREVAGRRSLPVAYRQDNYLTADLGVGHDAAILIYEDFCALSPQQRTILFARVFAALRPSGRFLFDVTSAARFALCADNCVSAPNLDDGFWAEPPYCGTHETWTYPDLRLVLDRYTIQTSAWTKQYWNWMQCLTPNEVIIELLAAGFTAPERYGNVAGAPYQESGLTFAIVTRGDDLPTAKPAS